MPEFPEVNLHVRYLRERADAFDIASVEHRGRNHFKLLRDHSDASSVIADFFEGNAITGIYQRGKLVVMTTDKGTLSSHLMFKGRWGLEGDPFISNYRHHKEPPSAGSATFTLTARDGRRLHLYTPEYKAHVNIHPGEPPDAVQHLTRLGPEVVIRDETCPGFDWSGWTLEQMEKRCGRSRAAIKALILDQKKVSGIGNMYACEALYAARIRPDRPANTLSPEDVQELHEAITGLIHRAIDSELDYESLLAVYKRDTDPSGAPVEVTRVSGRDTHWVPSVQI